MGSSNASVGQFSTDQLSAVYNALMPLISKSSLAAQTGQPLTTNMAGYMPNQGWYEGLDQSIKQGMWEPTNEAARNMINVMGGQGMLSARGGYSGSAQTALSDLYSKSATQQGLNAWNMMSPIQMQGFTNPWGVASGYAGTGQQLTPSPVITPAQPSALATYGPMAGMMIGGSLLNNANWGNILGGSGSWFG
jgi:hypothetical protein